MCRQGAEFGFDGKSLIHPSHIAIANAAFSPPEAEVAWARAVIAAFDAPENAGKGALRVDGRLAERLHRDQALRLVAMAEAIGGATRASTASIAGRTSATAPISASTPCSPRSIRDPASTTSCCSSSSTRRPSCGSSSRCTS